MNAEEMLEVFALINGQHPAAPHKKGRDEVNAWLAVLDPSMSYGEAHAGLREWYAAQSTFITPAALNNIVRAQRASRMAAERRAAMGELSHLCGPMRCQDKAISFREWSARNPDLAAQLRGGDHAEWTAKRASMGNSSAGAFRGDHNADLRS